MEKTSKSGHVLREKHRRLHIEDIAPTPPADAADESNVEDRSAFCFSVRYCITADQHLNIKIHMYARDSVSFCVHYLTCLQIVIVLTCNKYQIRPRKILQIYELL